MADIQQKAIWYLTTELEERLSLRNHLLTKLFLTGIITITDRNQIQKQTSHEYQVMELLKLVYQKVHEEADVFEKFCQALEDDQQGFLAELLRRKVEELNKQNHSPSPSVQSSTSTPCKRKRVAYEAASSSNVPSAKRSSQRKQKEIPQPSNEIELPDFNVAENIQSQNISTMDTIDHKIKPSEVEKDDYVDRLIKYRVILTKQMTLNGQLLNHLRSCGALTRNQYDTVTQYPGTVKDKVEQLLNILEKGHTSHVKTFFRALKEDDEEAGCTEELETVGFFQVLSNEGSSKRKLNNSQAVPGSTAQSGGIEPWPPFKAAYDMGPITVNINGQSVQEELEEVVTLASAIASSKVKGFIKLENTQYQFIDAETFNKWKEKVHLMWNQLIGDNCYELLEFGRNTANEKTFYLHVMPASTPLLIPPVFSTLLQQKMVMPKERVKLIEEMINLSQCYKCFVLNGNGKPVQLQKEQFKERMDKILELMAVKKIPGFPDEDMQRFKRVEMPNADCAVFTMYGADDMIQVKSGLQIWPEEYETLFGLDAERQTDNRVMVRKVIETLRHHYNETKGLLYISSYMKNDVTKKKHKKKELIICDILAITSADMPLLLTISFADIDLSEYSKDIVPYLDQSLSCTKCQQNNKCAFYVNHYIVTYRTLQNCNWFQEIITQVRENNNYPGSYLKIGEEKCESMMYSLYTSLASFVPSTFVSDKKCMDYVQTMNLLTVEQLNTLITCKADPAKVILLEALAGTGKTVVAVEYMKWIRSAGCDMGDILYVAYSKVLAKQISELNLPWCHEKAGEPLCKVTTIRDLLTWQELPPEFKGVKWWILDDVQNYAFVKKTVESLRNQDGSSSEDKETPILDASPRDRHISIPNTSLQATEMSIPHSMPQDIERSTPNAITHNIDRPVPSTSEERTSSYSTHGSTFIISDGPAAVMPDTLQVTEENPSTSLQSSIKQISVKIKTQLSLSIFKGLAPPHHWLAKMKFLTTGSNIEKMLIICDPTQALEKGTEEELHLILKDVNFDKHLHLKQISRNSIEISKFIRNLIPRKVWKNIGYTGLKTKDIVAHNYKGKEIAKNVISCDFNALRDMMNKQQHYLFNTHRIREEDLGIIIDRSAVQAETLESRPHGTDTLTQWGLLDDYVGREKPYIIAVLGHKAHWSQKVAIASRARVQLYWTELQEKVSSAELRQLFGSRNKSYIAWATKGPPAIAVFAGQRELGHTFSGTPLQRVVAAPLAPQGLRGGYGEVAAIPKVPHPRCCTAVVRFKDQVWLIGGQDKAGDKTSVGCDVLDLITWQWRSGPSLMTSRSRHTVTVVDGAMVAVGGQDEHNKALSSTEILTTESEWTPGPDLPGKRCKHAACEYEGRVYISGGLDDVGTKLSSVMSWALGEDSWRQEASLLTGRYEHMMVTTGGSLLVCGGRESSMEQYNSQSGTWNRLSTDLPARKMYSSAVVYGPHLYVVGGGDNSFSPSFSTFRFDIDWHEDRSLPWKMYDTEACLIELPNK